LQVKCHIQNIRYVLLLPYFIYDRVEEEKDINPAELRKVLSANIKARRKVLGISQEKLAELADLSVQAINSIEGCRTWVSDKTLTTLADVLGVQVCQLLSPAAALKEEESILIFSSILGSLKQTIKDDLAAVVDTRFSHFIKTNNKNDRKKSGRRRGA
jgi:transcriptional regulator with XRE-family HTH domain